MSEMRGGTSREGLGVRDAQATANPALGLVVTQGNVDHVLREILRARRHGHEAIVTAGREEYEALAYARALNAVVVDPPEDLTGPPDLVERLARTARESGFPGLLYHENPERRVDYEASSAALAESDRYRTEARVERPVDTDATVLVGIPAHNEAATIVPVVEAALDHADDVLVIDDGSDDETAELARSAGASVVQHESNSGYGGALKTLFEQADACRADHLVVVDADGQHDTNDIPDLVETQRETGAEVVVGCRFGEGADTEMPLYRRVGVGVVNLLTNFGVWITGSGSRLRDTQSGFRAYDRAAIQSLAVADGISDHMSASTDILFHAHANGFEVEEVPTTIDYEVENGSSHGAIEHGILLVVNILRTVGRERPITMLGIPGFVCTIAGTTVVYWAFYEQLQTGTFPLGLSVIGSAISLLGLLAAFTASMLYSLAMYNE